MRGQLVGDFGKYTLLRRLTGPDPTPGVVWHYRPDEPKDPRDILVQYLKPDFLDLGKNEVGTPNYGASSGNSCKTTDALLAVSSYPQSFPEVRCISATCWTTQGAHRESHVRYSAMLGCEARCEPPMARASYSLTRKQDRTPRKGEVLTGCPRERLFV